jgi:nitrogen regulatory protein PII
MQLVGRKRVEIVIDTPLCAWLTREAEAAGIPHHTLLAADSGRGRTGGWRDEDVSGALSKKMFVAVAKQEQVDALIDALAPHLDEYGLIVMISDVEVVRSERF